MDMLYSRYSNPLEFMQLYIGQGRFGEFVSSVIEVENKKKKEKEENRLWELYIHSYSDLSYSEWKKSLIMERKEKERLSDESLSDEDIQNIILKTFSDSTE